MPSPSPGKLPEQRSSADGRAAPAPDRAPQQDVRGRAHEGVLPAAGRRLRAAAGALAAAERLVIPAHVQVRIIGDCFCLQFMELLTGDPS